MSLFKKIPDMKLMLKSIKAAGLRCLWIEGGCTRLGRVPREGKVSVVSSWVLCAVRKVTEPRGSGSAAAPGSQERGRVCLILKKN